MATRLRLAKVRICNRVPGGFVEVDGHRLDGVTQAEVTLTPYGTTVVKLTFAAEVEVLPVDKQEPPG